MLLPVFQLPTELYVHKLSCKYNEIRFVISGKFCQDFQVETSILLNFLACLPQLLAHLVERSIAYTERANAVRQRSQNRP